jgi:ABC-type multidrug transport system fused ATPase/permease subunit
MLLLSGVLRQGRNYTALVAWILSGVFRGHASKLGAAIALSLVHLGSQAAAIYAVYWYGRQMERNGIANLPLLNIQLNLKEQPELLWAVLIFSTTCFLVSAAFLYLSRRQVLDIAERYYAQNNAELVLQSFHLPDSRARLASKLFMDYGVGRLSGGCRRAALMAISFANAITAVVGGLSAVAFLFWIDFSLTALILVSASLATLFLYPLTLRAMQSAKALEKAQIAFKKEVREFGKEWPVEQRKGLKTAEELARAYMMRRRVLTELIFSTELGVTIILGLVVYYMASEALAGHQQWAIFIAYIAALRMTLNGVAQPIRSFAGVSRYYPEIVRYYVFTKDMQRIAEVRFVKVRQGEVLTLGTLDNGKELVVEVGDRLAVVTTDLMRDLQYAFLDAKTPRSSSPIGTNVFDPTRASADDTTVALVAASSLDRNENQLPALLEGPLKEKVTLIVYDNVEEAGTFGEKRLLTILDGGLRRFAVFGSEEADAALQEFLLKNAEKSRIRAGGIDEDEDEED